jgi:hypothetical protein
MKTLENKYLAKLEEYEKRLGILCNRNSCSKTDPDATFMRLKDDHMQKGHLNSLTICKSALKISLLATSIFPPTRLIFLTFKPFVNGYRERFEGA